MDSPYIPAPCNPELAPRCCRRCGTPGSPKDSRVATQTLIDAEGRCYVDTEVRRDRLQCRVPGCPMWMKSWTVYEPGGYPHRRYALAVLVSAVSELAIVPEATFTSVAVRLACHRTTVARGVAWVATLKDTLDLIRACTRMDPKGLPPPSPPVAPPAPVPAPARVPPLIAALRRAAGHVLHLLERLADHYRHWRMPLEPGPGLVAILRYRFLATGEVAWLIPPSQATLVDGGRASP